jgi:4-hydroxybenzoate polyprenyltransferase
MSGIFNKLRTTLEMIKFEHTLFALPFAFLGAVMAADGLPTWRQILWITLAMIGARSAAMTFNRIVDRDIDAENPRTANRELPSGKLTIGFAWTFLFVSIALFLLAAYSLNWLTFALSPVALLSVLGYSYAKRFTSFAAWLGIGDLANCGVDRNSRRDRFRSPRTAFTIRVYVDLRIRRDVCVSGL